ncbi:MAG: hypothetical protein WBA89_03425 [Microcoleus sp.]
MHRNNTVESTVNSQQSTVNSQQFPRSATGIALKSLLAVFCTPAKLATLFEE